MGIFIAFFLGLFLSSAGQVINMGNGAEPKDLDPHIVSGVPESHILRNLFEALVSKHPKNLEPIPGAAEKWRLSKDGKVYTFFLRKDGKWSDGEAVTADDFIYSWERLLNPLTASEYAYQGYYIKNGRAYNEGKLKDPKALGLKAKDPYTLEVTLENPTSFFLGLLYHHSLYPVSKKAVQKSGTAWTRPGNLISNGAFILSKWETNKVITLKKNPFYWEKDKVQLEEANFYPIDNLDTEEKMFRTGKLHVTYELPLEKIPFWKKDKTNVYQANPYLGIYYYRLNVTKAPLNDVRVRKALNLAFNRQRLIDFVTRGDQAAAFAFTPPGTAGYQPPVELPKDLSRLEEGKKLLAEAGFPGGKGFPTLEILYNTHDGHKKIAEALQEMWKTNLGIQVKLLNQEWKVYLDSQKNLQYQISRAGWIADYNDPNGFLDMWVTGNGQNQTGYSNLEYDKLLKLAGQELNTQKRFAILKKAEEILLRDLPVLPIYVYKRNFLKRTEVVGWDPNIEDIHPLKYVSLSPRRIASP